MKINITSLLVCSLLFCACSSTNTSSADINEKPATGTMWYLKKIHMPSGVQEIKAGSDVFLRFDTEKTSAGGKGGCNSYGSDYTINGDNISFKNIFSTKMFCENFQQQEDNFFKQLQQVNKYVIKDGQLLLYLNNELLLEFATN